MARDTASFMLWLGDNWYTREVDITRVPGGFGIVHPATVPNLY